MKSEDYKKLNFLRNSTKVDFSSSINIIQPHLFVIRTIASRPNKQLETHGDFCLFPLFCVVVGTLFYG